MNITDEMVEAAARAIATEHGSHVFSETPGGSPYDRLERDQYQDEARAALSVAAPLIAAQALRSPDNVAKTVVATLRTAATWLESEPDSRTLFEVAGQVERDPVAEWCCHVCQEVVCDGGCPFEFARADGPAAP